MYETAHDVIKSLLRTEKGTNLLVENKYLFWVDKRSNKLQIKKAIEEVYKVSVLDVNTLNVKGKPKRVRYKLGKTHCHVIIPPLPTSVTFRSSKRYSCTWLNSQFTNSACSLNAVSTSKSVAPSGACTSYVA